MSDDKTLPRILNDFEVRAFARDAWRRQLAQDAALERKLAMARVEDEVKAQAARRAKSFGASQRGLFDVGVNGIDSDGATERGAT